MTKPLYLITLILALAGVMAHAAPTFRVIPPQRVFEGDKFPVTFRLDNGEGSDLRVSQINGCTLLFGPSTSTSRSYQVVNGHAQASSRMEYTFTYRADNAGTFTIPAASVVVDGKRLSTQPVKFTVQTSAQRNIPDSKRPTSIDNPDTQTNDRAVKSSDLFVRIILSRPSVYEQEAVECTIKLYTTYNITSFFPTKQPAFDGCLIEELDPQNILNAEETINGRTYLTAVLKRCIIYPQKSGRLTINSGNYDVTLVQFENVNMGGIMTVRQPVERKIQVTSNTAAIDVKPLPKPAPEGFTGAVGTFSVDSRLVGNTFRTNDPSTLIYTIKGTGNIKYVKEPVIDFPSEFEQYTPKSDIQAQVNGNNMTGTMTIDYTFVPQSVGDFTIGANKFVYFNPQTAQYVTLTTPSYNIKVAKGTQAASSADQEKIESKNTDIRHIHLGHTSLAKSHTPVFYSWWYWLLYVIVAAALALLLMVNRHNMRLAADVTGTRLARAGKVARKRLTAARKLMEAGKTDEFYAETLRALQGYLSDKLTIPAGQLSRQTINERLTERGANEALRQSVEQIIQDCEMARYTPDASANISRVYAETDSAINQIENLKKSKPMKRIFAILTALMPLMLTAANVIERADSAYAADNFQQAHQLYLQALKEGTSADLYYNLGNASYRMGHLGEAVLYYERALRISPTMDDARTNLEFVNSRITDRPGERGTFLGTAIDRGANAAGSNGWAWLAFAAFVLTAAGVCLYIFSTGVALRKAGFFGALTLALFCLIALFFSHRAATIATATDTAVVMKPSTILSTVPRTPKDRNEEAMLLHEGTTVKILDRVTAPGDSATMWYDVEVDNTHRAWISSADVEII